MRYLEYIKNTDATVSWKTKEHINFNAKIAHKIIQNIMLGQKVSINTFNNYHDASENSTIISLRGKLATLNISRSIITNAIIRHIQLYSTAYNLAKSYKANLHIYFTINNNQHSYLTGLESIIAGIGISGTKTIQTSPIPSTYIHNTEHYITNISRVLSSLTEIRNNQTIAILLKNQHELDVQLVKIIQTVHNLGIQNKIVIAIDEFKEIDKIYKEITAIYQSLPEVQETHISLGVRTTIDNIASISEYPCIKHVILNPMLSKLTPKQCLDATIFIT